jgi:hypothetical protein
MSVSIYPKGQPDNYLNISNINFRILWNFIGLPFDWCGESHPADILSGLLNFESDNITRKPQWLSDNMYDCGLSEHQVARYIIGLKKLCYDAGKAEVPIIWA